MNVITDELPEEPFRLIVEFQADSRIAVMSISRHFHGVSFDCSFVDQRVHLQPPASTQCE
jgi:hypothetical protein